MHAQSLLPPTLRGGMLRLPTWSLRVYTPPTTLISTTKKLDSVGPPPLGTTGRRSGRGACRPPVLPRVQPQVGSCPRWVQLRGRSGAGGLASAQAPQEQGTRETRGPGWRPRGAPRRRLQPRFKGHQGAEGSLPTAQRGSLRREGRSATARLGLSKFAFFVLPPREHPAADSFLPRVSPPPPAESRKSN